MKALHIATVILGMMTLVANAQMRPGRQQFPVQLSAVARTVVASLATRGIQISIDQVRLPSEVLANEESPALEVSAVEKLGRLSTSPQGEVSASIKLKCALVSACRPFFAIATWRVDQQQTPSADAKTTAVAGSIAKPDVERAAPVPAVMPSATVIKAGQPLTLFLDADHARIQIPVVSMASGSMGQKIRVSTPDHKHFYMAEVLNAGTVKGSF